MPTSYSEKELLTITKLRENVKDLELDEDWTSDSSLVKWLIARNFDVRKAEEMLRKSMIWRKENNIDQILEWTPPEEMKNAIPLRVCGYDEEGNTVMVVRLKDADPNIILKVDKRDYIKYRIQMAVKLMEEMKARNKRLALQGDQFITIQDLEGFSIRSVLNSKMLELISEVSHTMEENFPESVKIAFITHAPKMITYAMFLLKPFTPKTAIAKIRIFDSNSTKWGPEILKHIPASQVPPKYGGTNFEFEDSVTSQQLSISS